MKYRWLFLLICTTLTIGLQWSDQIPNILQIKFKDFYQIDEVYYSLTYSIYAFPNIIIPLFGGLLIYSIGKGSALIFVSSLVTLG